MVPFGIHNPPLFYEDSIPALIYGGLGMMLGHEITHGFDADRIRYDSDGNYTVSIYHYLDEKFAIDQYLLILKVIFSNTYIITILELVEKSNIRRVPEKDAMPC